MKWFGEDGRLLALPDPIKEISSRPPIIDDEGPALLTPYKHVCISSLNISRFFCVFRNNETIKYTHAQKYTNSHIHTVKEKEN